MFKFLLKKTFFNGWDNLGRIIVMNAISVLAILGSVAALHFTNGIPFYYVALIIFGCITVFTTMMFGFTGIEVLWQNRIKNWKMGVKTAFKGHFTHILYLSLLWSIIVLCLIFIIPFYIQAGSTVYFIVACAIFWVVILGFPCLQYFIPMTLRNPEDKPSVILKRCFAISADNKLLTLQITLRSLVDILISVFTCGLAPGFSGMALNCNEALNLIVLRHNYCEAKGISRKEINYKDMLKDEIEALGNKTIKTMLFPWKS